MTSYADAEIDRSVKRERQAPRTVVMNALYPSERLAEST